MDQTYSEKTLKCSVCSKYRINKDGTVNTTFFRSTTDRHIYFCSKECKNKITPLNDVSDRSTVSDLF